VRATLALPEPCLQWRREGNDIIRAERNRSQRSCQTGTRRSQVPGSQVRVPDSRAASLIHAADRQGGLMAFGLEEVSGPAGLSGVGRYVDPGIYGERVLTFATDAINQLMDATEVERSRTAEYCSQGPRTTTSFAVRHGSAAACDSWLASSGACCPRQRITHGIAAARWVKRSVADLLPRAHAHRRDHREGGGYAPAGHRLACARVRARGSRRHSRPGPRATRPSPSS
jgi:hypothetical protein